MPKGMAKPTGRLTTPEYEWEREWRWPWWKFEMHPTDLFTTLHARYNTRTCPIQDPGAFIVEVRECIDESPDVETFYAKMDERKDQRVRELEDAWSQVCDLMMALIIAEPICGEPDCRSREMDEKEPRTTTNDTRWARWAALAHMSRTMAFDNLISFFEGFVRDKRERERRERRLYDKRAAGRNKTPKSLLGDVASTVPAQAPIAAGDSSPPLHPPLSPVSAPSDEADEVTTVTPKTPDQSNDEKPAPAPATDAAAKTAAPPWRPRSPSPSSALSPSPPRKRRKTDGEEAQSPSRKRRHSVTGSGTNGGKDDGGAVSGYTSAPRKRARAAEGRMAREDGQPRGGSGLGDVSPGTDTEPMGRADTLK